eukprot:scaffold83323_cov27-Tisochrysis_lutea.AAC.4
MAINGALAVAQQSRSRVHSSIRAPLLRKRAKPAHMKEDGSVRGTMHTSPRTYSGSRSNHNHGCPQRRLPVSAAELVLNADGRIQASGARTWCIRPSNDGSAGPAPSASSLSMKRIAVAPVRLELDSADLPTGCAQMRDPLKPLSASKRSSTKLASWTCNGNMPKAGADI